MPRRPLLVLTLLVLALHWLVGLVSNSDAAHDMQCEELGWEGAVS